MTDRLLRTERDGVVELCLNRPDQRNALSTALLEDLRDALRALGDQPGCRALIVSGAGVAFCAGVDIKELGADAPANRSLARVRLVSELLGRLAELEQPTIAAVDGAAIGAGWGLALACDLCFATPHAHFSLPEVSKGLRLPSVLMRRLIALAGPLRAAEIALGGASYDAAGALQAGLLTRLLATRAELDAAAWKLACALAAAPRRSVQTAKRSLRAAASSGPLPPPELTWNDE